MHQYTLESVRVDIKRTQTKNKTFREYQSNDKIHFTFFGLPYDFFLLQVEYPSYVIFVR